MSISVVVPVYNRADLIGATLDSILAQDLPATEVIVVDDGSTDGTPEVVATYLPRIRVIRVVNGGDLAARNIGLRAAACPLVAFCDSDDLWRPGFLQSMARFWDHTPDLIAAYGNFAAIHCEVWDERTKFDYAPSEFWNGLRPAGPDSGVFDAPIIERLLTFQPFFPSAMMVNRTLFMDAGGWDEAVSRVIGTDFATALRVAERPLGVFRQPLVGIRRHSGNFSGDAQAMNLGDAVILEHVLRTRPSAERYRAAILASVGSRRAAAADIAFDRRDFSAVRLIHAMLPSERRLFRRRLKGWISRLPIPLARRLADLAGLIG